MKTRIHIVLDEAEKARLERVAREAGRSLSAWLREAAREKAESGEGTSLATREELEAFFAQIDAREEGREPDWQAHLEVIEASRRLGVSHS